MKISIFIGSLAGGGAERVTCALSNYLILKNYDINIVTMSDVDSQYFLNSKIKVIPLIKNEERKNFIYNLFVRLKRLKEYLIKDNSDLYLSMSATEFCIMTFINKRMDKPITFAERTNPKNYSFIKKIIIRFFAKKADGAVFQTEDAQLWYKKIIKNAVTYIIPNSINTDILKIKSDCKAERNKEIVSVGRLSKEKNFPLLINAFTELSDKYYDYRLLIYGEGKLRKHLQKLIDKNNMNKRILLCGFSKNVWEKIVNASAFILPSNFEGMSNALMEALALGIPCIATDCPIGGSKFLINNNENGILIPCKNKKELKKAIIKIINDKCFSNKISNNSILKMKNFDENTIFSIWDEFFNNTYMKYKEKESK